MITDALLLALGKAERVTACRTLGSAAIVVFVIFCIHRITKFFVSGSKEQNLIRMEVGKLAEELRLLRNDLKGNRRSSSSTQ